MIVEELFATLGLELNEHEWEHAEGAMGKLKVAAGGFIAALGLHEMFEMVKSVTEMGEAAQHSSQKLGISAEAVQELGYAAKISKVSQEELEGALVKLSRGMNTLATTGGGPAADALAKLHINVKDLKGEKLDANLEVISDAFKKMPDGAEKAAIATELFGRSGGARLIPFLDRGSAGIRQLREEAQKLGVVVSDETAKDMEEFNESQIRLSETWRGLKVQVVSALLPTLQELVESLIEWTKENRELISGGLHAFLTVAAYAAKGLAFAVHLVLEGLAFLNDNSDIAIAVLGAIALVFGEIAIEAAIAAAAELLALLPIILIIAAVAALIYAIRYMIQHWDKVKEVVGKVWEYIKHLATSVLEAIMAFPRMLVEGFIDMGTAIVKAIGDAFDWAIAKAKSAAIIMKEAILSVPKAIFASDERANNLLFGVQPGGTGAATIPGEAGTSSQVTVGDTHITVQAGPGMNEDQIASLVAAKTAEQQKTMLESAYDSMKGGKR